MKNILISLFLMVGMVGAAHAQNATSIGQAGPRGYTGARGPAGTITINSVTTVGPLVSASVNNVGNATNADWNISLPRGSIIFSGTTTPPTGTGLNGDYYLDTNTVCLYGPMASNAWPSTCLSLIGNNVNQNANTIFSGPSGGAATSPTFRAMVMADLPAAISGSQPQNFVYAAPLTGSGTPSFRLLTAADMPSSVQMATVTMHVSSSSPLLTGDTKTYLQVDYAGKIVGWSVTADQPGSISIDIWKVPSGLPPATPSIPSSANKISASAPVTLVNSQSSSTGTEGVLSWTNTNVNPYDVFGFNITAANAVKSVTVQLFIQKQ